MKYYAFKFSSSMKASQNIECIHVYMCINVCQYHMKYRHNLLKKCKESISFWAICCTKLGTFVAQGKARVPCVPRTPSPRYLTLNSCRSKKKKKPSQFLTAGIFVLKPEGHGITHINHFQNKFASQKHKNKVITQGPYADQNLNKSRQEFHLIWVIVIQLSSIQDFIWKW